MESSNNMNLLCKSLIDINKRYESATFVDIDFIDLFGLHSIKSISTNVNIDQIKKKITKKYYSLALKYHPDKYINSIDTVAQIKNCFVNMEDIKSGQFLSFIYDIYTMLNNMIVEDPESLINLINGNTDEILNKFDLNYDFNNLKKHFDNSHTKEYLKASDEQIKEFNNELEKQIVSEIKIELSQSNSLIEFENEKRNKLKIETIFTEEQQNSKEFINVFNEMFDLTKDKTFLTENLNSSQIQPFNFNNSYDMNLGFVSTGLSNTISDIAEAFEPIKVNSTIQTQKLSFDELLAQRKHQDKQFKQPLNLKS